MNDVSVVNVSHSVAVEALKKAGNRVVLQIKRKLANAEPRPEDLLEVELSKGSKVNQLSSLNRIVPHSSFKSMTRASASQSRVASGTSTFRATTAST